MKVVSTCLWGRKSRGDFCKTSTSTAPVLSGYDPVMFAERGTLENGKRAHGIFFRQRVYLFADENSLQRFWANPERYAGAALARQPRAGERQYR